jgi:hypothetical protein
MKTAIAIVQNIILPQLEKDSKFSEEKVDAAFWEKFTTDLLHFEEDAKPIYGSIYSLELANAEKIIDKLPNIHAQFLKELAESYVLGEPLEATDYLLKTNNATFAKEIDFLKAMQQAIKSVERKRIKADLPKSYERLTFELSETDLANVTKKKGREDLKEKFKNWDAELEEQEYVPVVAMLANENKNEKQTKVISLSWMKYAAAASIIIAAGIFYLKNTDTDLIPIENTVVTKEEVKDKIQHQINPPTVEAIALAPIETTSKTLTLLQAGTLGFTTSKKEKITINFKDASSRIASLEKIIDTSKTIDSKILSQYNTELASLKTQKNKYMFDGEKLTLFMKNDITEYSVFFTEDQTYFLKKGSGFYHLKISKAALPLEKVSNVETIEILEKISFENE